MDETPGRGPGGSRFESGRSPQSGDFGRREASYAFSSGFDPRPRHDDGPAAQEEAQLPCKEKVVGSTPARSTLT